jgi:hypothetical protein
MDAPLGLSSETEEILRRARQGERMPTTHKRRLKGAVLARIAFASTATLAAGQATVSAMGVGFAAKAVVGIALVGSLGAGITLALRPARPHVEMAVPRFVSTLPPAVIEPPAPSPVAPPVIVKAPIAHARRSALRPVAVSTLADETALLRDADRALRAGDTSTAMERLDEHATRFPKGTLAPERSAERLIVLCEVGAADQRAISEFLAERSSSPLAARVRRACAPKP